MPDERKTPQTDAEPFRESESGDTYNPQGNWGAERRLDNPSGGNVTGSEGAPSGSGYGGFGPEGDYTPEPEERNKPGEGDKTTEP
jgi:hypothetical protein